MVRFNSFAFVIKSSKELKRFNKNSKRLSISCLAKYVLAHLRLDLPLFECHGTVQTSLFLTFILSRVNPDPVCHTGNFLKSLFGLCELRHCGHNTQKIISPANQNLPVLTANHKITWWLRPQTPR